MTEPTTTNVTVLGLTDVAAKAISLYSASMLYSQPQFTKDTSPDNIVGLADLFYKYIVSQVTVTQPKETIDPEPMTYA